MAVILSQGKDKGSEKHKDKGWDALSSSQRSRSGSQPSSPVHYNHNNTTINTTYDSGGGDNDYRYPNARPASASGYHNNRSSNNYNNNNYYDNNTYHDSTTEQQQQQQYQQQQYQQQPHANPQLQHRSLLASPAPSSQMVSYRPHDPPPSSSSHAPGSDLALASGADLALVPDAARALVPASAAVDHFLSRLSDNDMFLLQQVHYRPPSSLFSFFLKVYIYFILYFLAHHSSLIYGHNTTRSLNPLSHRDLRPGNEGRAWG